MINVDPSTIPIQDVVAVAHHGAKVGISDAARVRIERGRATIDQILVDHRVVYGINTGFGRLSDARIEEADLERLQLNLVRSHAVGVGHPLSIPETRAMMLLRANVLAQGHSGARLQSLQHLVEMLNRGVHPVIPMRGSVGASGDLAPLAHLAMAMIGEGECHSDRGRIPSAEALAAAGLHPLTLQAKEGLALLNGTQAIGAVGGLALAGCLRLCQAADLIGVMTLEGLLGSPDAFDERIQNSRRQIGQIKAAEHLRQLMQGSEIRESHRTGDHRVQDAYCLRCMPQVHGSVRAALCHVQSIFEAETGAATDNPLVFPEENDVISGGNFHAAPLAHAFDYAAIVMTDLLSISERRMDRLVNPDSSEGLPPFLARNPGLESGLMMAHVTVAALLNECKGLAHPASVDSLPTSGGKEDHVSMGMTSAIKLRQIVQNVAHGLAIELIAAAEALEHRKPLRPGPAVQAAHDTLRQLVPPFLHDRSLSADIEIVAQHLLTGKFETQLQSPWQLLA